MKLAIRSLRQRVALLSVSACALALAIAGPASAAQTYTGIETDISAEVAAAMPVVLGVAALAIAVPFALKLIKRVAR